MVSGDYTITIKALLYIRVFYFLFTEKVEFVLINGQKVQK